MVRLVMMTPESKSSDFVELKAWARHELSRLNHEYQSGPVEIKRGATANSVLGLKCIDHATGRTYFLFPRSIPVDHNDLLVWAGDEEWRIVATNQIRQGIRCDVRRPTPADKEIDELLRSCGLLEPAAYLLDAKERLAEETPAALANCKTACRNALLSAVRQLTGEGGFKEGVKKLRDVCSFGTREEEHLKALENLLLKSKDLLSKAGPHPPMPDQASATLALELTKAILRFMATKSQRLGNYTRQPSP